MALWLVSMVLKSRSINEVNSSFEEKEIIPEETRKLKEQLDLEIRKRENAERWLRSYNSRIHALENKVLSLEAERKVLIKEINTIDKKNECCGKCHEDIIS